MSDSAPAVSPPVIWLFNVDADVELAVGRGYAPSRTVLAAMEEPRARLARKLARPGDGVVVEDATGTSIVRAEEVGRPKFKAFRGGAGAVERGRAFCPTPRAVALLRKLGVEPEAHPSFEVLRHVNGRAFCAELGQNLLGSCFATSLDEALRVIAIAPPIGRQWRAKRAFGMAGRGQRPIAPGLVSDADVSYLRASIDRDGGIQIEPEVEITRELGMHAMLAGDGGLRIGNLVEQRCDDTGQWLGSRVVSDQETITSVLRTEVERVAGALHEAGYFGPFGIDAYGYRVDNELRFNPRSEINARYSMGFSASGL